MMAGFDALPFAESCPRRSATTTPLQALSMMNGALESRHLAERIHREAGPDRKDQIDRAFAIVRRRRKSCNASLGSREAWRRFAAFSSMQTNFCM